MLPDKTDEFSMITFSFPTHRLNIILSFSVNFNLLTYWWHELLVLDKACIKHEAQANYIFLLSLANRTYLAIIMSKMI